MKRFLLLWAFVALTACHAERVVEDPVVECNRTKSVTVARIAALRDSTVVDLELRNLPGNWVRLSSRTVLRGGTTGEESPLLRADEFPLDEKVPLNRTGLRRVRLVFGAVSRHDSTVDLLEPDGYRIEGIRLEAVRRPAGKLRCRIEGEVVDRPQSSLLLLYAFTESGSQMSDPEALIPIREGRFTYDLDLDAPDYYQLVFADEEMRGSFLPIGFIADACGVRMTLYPEDEGLERNQIGGGVLNDELDGYQARLRRLSEPYERAMDSLDLISAAFTPEAQRLVDCMTDRSISAERRREASRRYMQLFRSGEAYGPEFRRLMAEQQTAQRRYLDSLLTGEPTLPRLVLLAEAIVRKRGEAYKPLFEQRYATAFADHPLVRFCAERLAAETVREGMPYVDFSAPDLDGKERRVSELVAGKQLFLLDFWASWCGPCRRSAMALIPIYEQYADRGFTVVGIARERHSTDAMRRSVEKDGYPWINLVELDDRGGLWARYGRYGAAGFQVLVDGEGRILRFDPEPDELRRLLSERLAR